MNVLASHYPPCGQCITKKRSWPLEPVAEGEAHDVEAMPPGEDGFEGHVSLCFCAHCGSFSVVWFRDGNNQVLVGDVGAWTALRRIREVSQLVQ